MKFVLITFLFLFLPTFSFSKIHRPGLLTDDYGIVTKRDLDEDEEGCTEIKDFAHQNGCMPYWQCLSTKDVKITCKRLWPMSMDSTERYGDFTLNIKDRGETHIYEGRHNGSMAECKAMKREMLKVMVHENTVCISGEFVDKESQTSGWIIDRMKSRHGEWSWFQREKDK
jgi:hypothetical protein